MNYELLIEKSMKGEHPICVINNPECVIEVFINNEKKEVVERKRLNDNRYKTYTYQLQDYLDRYKHKSNVYNSLMAAIN